MLLNLKFKCMQIKIEHKGFSNPRPEESEKKNFNSETSVFQESENNVEGFKGRQFKLLDSNGNLVGDLLLTRDDPNDSWVKIRVFGLEKPYRGSDTVNFLYDKSFEIAKEDNKDLVLDSVATIPAYKSLIKYIQSHNLKYEENPQNKFQELNQTYHSLDNTYTIRVKKEDF